MRRPIAPADKTRNWPAYSEPLKRLWFEHNGERAQAPWLADDLVRPELAGLLSRFRLPEAAE